MDKIIPITHNQQHQNASDSDDVPVRVTFSRQSRTALMPACCWRRLSCLGRQSYLSMSRRHVTATPWCTR